MPNPVEDINVLLDRVQSIESLGAGGANGLSRDLRLAILAYGKRIALEVVERTTNLGEIFDLLTLEGDDEG